MGGPNGRLVHAPAIRRSYNSAAWRDGTHDTQQFEGGARRVQRMLWYLIEGFYVTQSEAWWFSSLGRLLAAGHSCIITGFSTGLGFLLRTLRTTALAAPTSLFILLKYSCPMGSLPLAVFVCLGAFGWSLHRPPYICMVVTIKAICVSSPINPTI